LQPLANLRELEELHLGGVPVTDAGLTHLAGLTRLRKLDLLSSDVTDAGLDQLAGMNDLEYLNLYRTKVWNPGLQKLKRCAKVHEVDLRYSRATQAGVQSLRAALPNARFIFPEDSLKTAGAKPQAPGPAGSSDSAVAAWVRSAGGKAVMENGALLEVTLSGA